MERLFFLSLALAFFSLCSCEETCLTAHQAQANTSVHNETIVQKKRIIPDSTERQQHKRNAVPSNDGKSERKLPEVREEIITLRGVINQ